MVSAVNLKLLSRGDMVQRLGLPMGKLRLVTAMVRGLGCTAWVRESMSGSKAQARGLGLSSARKLHHKLLELPTAPSQKNARKGSSHERPDTLKKPREVQKILESSARLLGVKRLLQPSSLMLQAASVQKPGRMEIQSKTGPLWLRLLASKLGVRA